MKKQERGGEYMKKLWELAKGFAAEEDAVGVVEIILIYGRSDWSGYYF